MIDKQYYYYLNMVILAIGILISFILLSRKKKDLNNIESYDWKRFSVLSEGRNKTKKPDLKEKQKIRIKGFSKGNGFIKEENTFPVSLITDKGETSNDQFLSVEETQNLQDMINYAATVDNKIKNNREDSVESMYRVIHSTTRKDSSYYANGKINIQISDILLK